METDTGVVWLHANTWSREVLEEAGEELSAPVPGCSAARRHPHFRPLASRAVRGSIPCSESPNLQYLSQRPRERAQHNRYAVREGKVKRKTNSKRKEESNKKGFKIKWQTVNSAILSASQNFPQWNNHWFSEKIHSYCIIFKIPPPKTNVLSENTTESPQIVEGVHPLSQFDLGFLNKLGAF